MLYWRLSCLRGRRAGLPLEGRGRSRGRARSGACTSCAGQWRRGVALPAPAHRSGHAGVKGHALNVYT
jgi:hypothetical protein